MIELDRRKNHKWILQKNVSSKDIIQAYLDVLNEGASDIDYQSVQDELRNRNIYRGRSYTGSLSTMGVRFSQMCFYMFGYKINNTFIPSPMTSNLLDDECAIPKESNSLVNLFSMQFPHPYSDTHSDFNIYAGRLFIKLLLEDRIEKKLYIDEIIWFLPFIETINEQIYDELVDSILEYRSLSYYQKKQLFQQVRNCDDVFANVTHEFNYYFLRIFRGFGVVSIIADPYHNGGQLFRFHHGTRTTMRTDAYDSGKSVSGYVVLKDSVVADAKKLIDNFSAFDSPTTMNTEGIYSKRDWLTAIYDTEPLGYLNCINSAANREKKISDIVQTMVYASRYGSHDGKEFENSLKPFMELFREAANVEIISGAGNTDLLCTMEDAEESLYKMNVDAKTRRAGLEEINARRLENHLERHGSKFCIVVAPRFASGIEGDIAGHRIVTVRADDFGSYCYKECKNNRDGFADFESIHNIIENSMGTDITEQIRDLTTSRYGIAI